MNALVKKEIRLLLPAWIVALLLVLAPIPLALILDVEDTSASVIPAMGSVVGVAIGCILLGLAGFGREVSSGTLSLLLAQPRPRRESWRAKVGVLVGSLIPLALLLGLVLWLLCPPSERGTFALVWFLTACVSVTGGLWTTLLFRQIIASFWISVLVPFAILASVILLDDRVVESRTGSILVTVLLLAYSVAGYFFARWQFRHAQDTAWTGGNLTWPGGERWMPWARARTMRPKMHPLRALLGKEFQFQQVSFLLAGLLLLVQIAVLLVQKFVNLNENTVLAMIVQNFWGIWIIMPLLVGCSAVAEERKLGTLEPQLCLPVARAWQFAVKVFVTLICGTLLGALVPVVISFAQPLHGTYGMEFAVPWTLACVWIAFVAFYASSLTHQLLQALGAAIGIIVVGFFFASWFSGSFSRGNNSFSLFGTLLWQGPLVCFVGAGVMLVFAMGCTWRRRRWVWAGLLALVAVAVMRGAFQGVLTGGLATESYGGIKAVTLIVAGAFLCPVALTLALAAKNFEHAQTSLLLWWRNATTWLICFALTGVITAVVYNRVWELAMPFEPAAGAPRLSGSVSPVITRSFVDHPAFDLLPDGRVCSYKVFERIPPTHANSEPTWRPIQDPQVKFVGGSNWVAFASTYHEAAGIQSDGSLWRSFYYEWVDKAGNVTTYFSGSPAPKGSTSRPTELKFERFGNESAWATVAASEQHCVALKRDGTIWGWGNNWNQQLGDGPKFITNAPVQLGKATNWTAVYAGNGHSYAVNREGEIWKWGKFETKTFQAKVGEGPVKLNIKVPGVRSVSAGDNNFDLVLDADGNLWGLGRIPPALSGEKYGWYGGQYYSDPRRLGGSNWLAVSCSWQSLIGLKADGTLWRQRSQNFYSWPLPRLEQLGKRTDWIAVRTEWEADLALAGDGTICRFGNLPSGHEIELLAPTRRVTWSLNLLDAAK